jgi:hypothetical protein
VYRQTLHELDLVIVVVEVDVPRSQSVALHELLVSGWSLILHVAGQHALQAHADALDVLDRAPALVTEEIETDDSVRIDVGVYRYGAVGFLLEDHFRRLWSKN